MRSLLAIWGVSGTPYFKTEIEGKIKNKTNKH